LVGTVTATSSPPGGRLDFIDGRFLGIRQGTLLADATEVLGVEPVQASSLDPATLRACLSTADAWVVRTGGLTLVFEEVEGVGALLTNWTYEGGPIAGYDELYAPHDLRIGDTRHDLTTAFPDSSEHGDAIDIYQPFLLRFGLDGDTIAWFGVIDCALENNDDPATG
jgi:hypothetical protein